MPIHNRLLLFDFDGVMVDSFQAGYTTAKNLIPDLTEEKYRSFFMGNVYRESVKNGAPDTGDAHANDPFFVNYTPKLLKSPVVSGMRDVLEQLSLHFHSVIVSSTINSPIEEYLKMHDMMHYFELVYGADVHKLKTEKIKMAMKKFGLPNDSCLFITDTVGDIREARHVDVNSIAVSWGFHPKEDLESEQPLAVVDSPEELASEIRRQFVI